MAALIVLIAVAMALLVLGAIARAAPRLGPALQTAVCLLGAGAALLARSGATLDAGPTLAVDALSAAMLAAFFLLGASGAAPRRPMLLGFLALALLADDALTLLAALGAAILAARPGRRAIVPFAALAVALLALGWHGVTPGLRFAAIRTIPPEGSRATIVLLATLVAAASLPIALPLVPGALAAFYLLARLLLDLPGSVTPGWWGVPTLAGGALAALALARRAGAADDLHTAVEATGAATIGLAVASLGATLLARGADLSPLAATAIASAFLLVLAWSVWGSLLLLATSAIDAAIGTTTLARLGGLLRRTPATGLALLIALASMAALPLSAGFAPIWLLLQALLASAHVGGTALLALVAGALATLGLTLALLAAAALRLAGAALLGRPRGTRAAAATEPARPVRLAMAALATATLIAGVAPGVLLLPVQPVAQLLAGGAAEGAGAWSFAAAADAPGYAAPATALLLAAAIALATAARQGAAPVVAAPWQGGLAEPVPAAIPKLKLWPAGRTGWRHWRPAVSARLVIAILALSLAATLGWAAR